MGERIEAVLAVITTHPACPNATKEQFVIPEVKQTVVDATSSECDPFAEILLDFSIAAENICAKRERITLNTVSYTHLRAHETVLDIVCRLLLEKKK